MSNKKTRPLWQKILLTSGKVLGFIATFAVLIVITLLITMQIIVRTSSYARTSFISTVLETGQMKFLARLSLSEEEINEVIKGNSMKELNEEVDEGLITVHGGEQGTVADVDYDDEKDIEIIEISGLTYKATLMIVKDPSRVSVAAICDDNGKWPTYGIPLADFAPRFGAIGCINGGLYNQSGNSGGHPYGVVVSNGKILRNYPQEWGALVLIGITDKNILQIIDISQMSQRECEEMIKERGIRDGVCFQDEMNVEVNHFVQLIINGVPRDVTGRGSGLNPRTAIGQRADGAMLLLVTDGRGTSSHAGASAADLIDIMLKYGAVNAANLDGGSSTCMYYNGEYLQTSTTFYFSQTTWKLPCAFIVK
ncbi:MAG: phosphodiester glycosidase family protein [Clostridia bacterium]|nr:phosphodiester glycosidase family protein [Clostridia bacterium]MBR5746772.1 phosphodiester glycosidase family protein [Clostridia bacterium]